MSLNKHEQERRIAEAVKKTTIKVNTEKKAKTNDATKKSTIK